MKKKTLLLRGVFCLVVSLNAQSVNARGEKIPQLDNPITVEYLQKHLRSELPRLVITPDVEREFKQKLKTDPLVQNMYAAVQLNAEAVFQKKLLERELVGRRLLSVSRDMLLRMNVLGLVYRIEKEPKVLARINEELLAVCAFENWNPKHFLDVGEMSLAVALALDWTAGDLPEATINTAQDALIHKGLLAEGKAEARIVRGQNNWNQVCNGGMIAAALAVADIEPELAASTLQRALAALPNALVHYGPDGVHPEGASYWGYASEFTAATAAMLESALGSDFGIWDYPGFADSAMYRVLMNTPSGYHYNYGDCSDKRSSKGDIVLAWFAAKSGDETFLERDRFMQPPERMGTLHRLAGMGLIWLSQFEASVQSAIPSVWAGRGINPVAIFTGGAHDPRKFYLGAKGGSGAVSHGNMDAGSFVLELDGVRWSIDPGKQDYNSIEQTGFGLWNSKQDGDRWKLLTKNNFGHSTLTVNGELHRVAGHAPLLSVKKGENPEAIFDLSQAFGDFLTNAKRSFLKDSPFSVIISDSILESEKTKEITWQMITAADIELIPGGAMLRQQGKTLKLEILSHPALSVSVVSLNPPPHKLDRVIKSLKRLEIKVPVTGVAGSSIALKVRLSGVDEGNE